MCFGPSARRIWPRGFPLELVKHKHVSAFGFGEFSGASVGVVQSLADQDPDVDAVYRLTMDLPVHFSNASSTLVLANGVFSPFNTQATLHMGTAFWGLYLPVSVHGRVSDIWRSYICQRLMWDVGLSVALVNPRVTQVRKAHRYSADFVAEDDLYKKSPALTQYLAEWEGRSTLLSDRIVELYVELYEREFVHLEDVGLVQLWAQALLDFGYQFPPLLDVGFQALPAAAGAQQPAAATENLPGRAGSPALEYSHAQQPTYAAPGCQPATRHHPGSPAAALAYTQAQQPTYAAQEYLPDAWHHASFPAAAPAYTLTALHRTAPQQPAKRVLITGITGMLGSQIARTILARYNWEVNGLVRWCSSLTNL